MTNPDRSMTEPDLDGLLGLLAKATNVGDWRIGRLGNKDQNHVVDFGEPPKAGFMILRNGTPSSPGFIGFSAGGVSHSDHGDSADNAAFIVAIANAAPSLLATLAQHAATEAALRAEMQQADYRIRRLEAALRVARGWVINGTSSALARSDLRTIDAALGLSREMTARTLQTKD